MVRFSYASYSLKFKEPGGTSRGVLSEKPTYFLRAQTTAGEVLFGEIPYFPGLSPESKNELEAALQELGRSPKDEEFLSESSGISSLDFALQQIRGSLHSRRKGVVYPSEFTEGETSITINGLIWMGDFTTMMRRVEEKISLGYRCIKLKIGSIHWDEELRLIRAVRQLGGPEVTIRVDANGALNPSECLAKLEQLSALGVHSIEQPIKPDYLDELAQLCRVSPLPIALDESLIGIPKGELREQLLDQVLPQFLILKPALCYGFDGTADWINLARERGIGWWVTSALESSVGLDAIAQFTATFNPEIPQGLGTGALYTNNFDSPLSLQGDRLTFCGPSAAYYPQLEKLDWIG